jgi:hypothetical protein
MALRFLPLCLVGGATLGQVSPAQKATALHLLAEASDSVSSELRAEAARQGELGHWCDREAANRTAAISTAATLLRDSSAKAAEAQATGTTLSQEAETLSAKVSANRADLRTASFLRDQEHRNFAATEKELIEGTLDNIDKALGVVNAQKSGFLSAPKDSGFLSGVKGLVRLIGASWLEEHHKTVIRSLVDPADPEAGSPRTVAALTTMRAKAEKTLSDARRAESEATTAYNLLNQGLEVETNEMQERLKLIAAMKPQYAESANVAAAAHDAILQAKTADEKYLASMQKYCSPVALGAVLEPGRAALQALIDAQNRLERDATWGTVADAARNALAAVQESRYGHLSAAAGVLAELAQKDSAVAELASYAAGSAPQLRSRAQALLAQLQAQAAEPCVEVSRSKSPDPVTQQAESAAAQLRARQQTLMSALSDSSATELRHSHHAAARASAEAYERAAEKVRSALRVLPEGGELTSAGAELRELARAARDEDSRAQGAYDGLRALDEVAKSAKTVELHALEGQVIRLEQALTSPAKGPAGAKLVEAVLVSVQPVPCEPNPVRAASIQGLQKVLSLLD